MLSKKREDYEVEDFVADESFINYHFRFNAADALNWTSWLEQHPDKIVIVKQAKGLLDALSLSVGDEEYNIELKKIKNVITDGASSPAPYFNNVKAPVRTIFKSRVLLACIIVAAFVGGCFWFYASEPFPEQLAQAVNSQDRLLTIVLSDSTVVTLSPHSTLKYPTHFPQGRRNVYLDGDALFHVKRNETAPFKVFSQNIVATVLGTTFHFKKGGDSATVIELLEGKLNVQMNEASGISKSILLHPNEKAVYMKRAHAFYKKPIRPQTDIAFRQSGFNEIAAKVKDAFGITLINKSGKSDWRFTGDFKKTTAEELIATICLVKKVTADVKSDTVYMK